MKVILSEQCLSLTGMLERGLGYHLEHRKNGFFSKRDQRGFVPPDGHWRFIVLCLYEAKRFTASEQVRRNYADKCKATYNARDVLNLKTTFGL